MTNFLLIIKRLFIRRRYVITSFDGGKKYYYKGKNSLWTSDLNEAMIYKKPPTFEWLGFWHEIEEIKI